MDKRIAETIGRNLQRLRAQRGWTQEQLAEKAGISTSFCANIERGIKGVSLPVLYNLANTLGVSVDYLLYPEQSDARIRNIQVLLKDKPESFIISLFRRFSALSRLPMSISTFLAVASSMRLV